MATNEKKCHTRGRGRELRVEGNNNNTKFRFNINSILKKLFVGEFSVIHIISFRFRIFFFCGVFSSSFFKEEVNCSPNGLRQFRLLLYTFLLLLVFLFRREDKKKKFVE